MADSRRQSIAAALVLVTVAAALLLWQRPWVSEPAPAPTFPANAAELLADQVSAWSAAVTEEDFVAAAGSSKAARAFATDVWEARELLGIEGVTIRHASGGTTPDRADGTASATVIVDWHTSEDSVIAGTAIRSSEVDLRVEPGPDGLEIVGASAARDRLPLWMAGHVELQETEDAVVVTIDGGVDGLPLTEMTEKAAKAVRVVDPGASGDLVVIAPSTITTSAGLLGQTTESIADIAAVTTTVDGEGETARIIVLNPKLFTSMDRRASQVVLTHEATHLMTASIGTRAPTWVNEGFADFVALHDDTADLKVSAGQVLEQVKASGPPARLPTDADFAAARGHGLGAVYEGTWMIFRLLGETHTDADIVAFYDDAVAGKDAEKALRDRLGLTVAQLTAQWRDYLTKSASTVS